MSTLPLTPAEKTLKRVLFISGLDGWTFVIIAGASLLCTALFFNPVGVFVSVLVLVGGIMELRGRRQLKRRNPEGMQLLARSQLLILAVILVYCARCLASFDSEYVRSLVPEVRQMLFPFGINLDDALREAGMTASQLVAKVHTFFVAIYATFAFLTLCYQGGMTLYYRSRAAVVAQVLAAPPRVAANPPLA